MKLLLSLEHFFVGVRLIKGAAPVVCACGCGKIVGTVRFRFIEIGLCPFVVLVIQFPASMVQEGA